MILETQAIVKSNALEVYNGSTARVTLPLCKANVHNVFVPNAIIKRPHWFSRRIRSCFIPGPLGVLFEGEVDIRLPDPAYLATIGYARYRLHNGVVNSSREVEEIWQDQVKKWLEENNAISQIHAYHFYNLRVEEKEEMVTNVVSSVNSLVHHEDIAQYCLLESIAFPPKIQAYTSVERIHHGTFHLPLCRMERNGKQMKFRGKISVNETINPSEIGSMNVVYACFKELSAENVRVITAGEVYQDRVEDDGSVICHKQEQVLELHDARVETLPVSYEHTNPRTAPFTNVPLEARLIGQTRVPDLIKSEGITFY